MLKKLSDTVITAKSGLHNFIINFLISNYYFLSLGYQK